jgi:DNA invertase Pin-like site-specific DNA recombinase
MAVYGYARVSMLHQETNLQLDAFARAGVEVVFEEKASSVGRRPELERLLTVVQAGDAIVVYRLDRLARSLRDLLRILDRVAAVGCSFRSLTEPIDTSTPIGTFILQVLGAVAELERNIIRERSVAGQVAAINRGAVIGRPRALSDAQELDVFDAWAVEGVPMAALARRYQVTHDVVQRIVYRMTRPDHPRIKGNRPVLGPLLEANKKKGP